MAKKKIFIVVTFWNDGEVDQYSDVIGVYANDAAAERFADKLTKRMPVRGIDYSNLTHFEKAAVLVFDLGCHINNKD